MTKCIDEMCSNVLSLSDWFKSNDVFYNNIFLVKLRDENVDFVLFPLRIIM